MRYLIKHDTTRKKFRLFRNRFDCFVLQAKEKKAPKSSWVIINAFAKKDKAEKYFQLTITSQFKDEFAGLATNNN